MPRYYVPLLTVDFAIGADLTGPGHTVWLGAHSELIPVERMIAAGFTPEGEI